MTKQTGALNESLSCASFSFSWIHLCLKYRSSTVRSCGLLEAAGLHQLLHRDGRRVRVCGVRGVVLAVRVRGHVVLARDLGEALGARVLRAAVEALGAVRGGVVLESPLGALLDLTDVSLSQQPEHAENGKRHGSRAQRALHATTYQSDRVGLALGCHEGPNERSQRILCHLALLLSAPDKNACCLYTLILSPERRYQLSQVLPAVQIDDEGYGWVTIMVTLSLYYVCCLHGLIPGGGAARANIGREGSLREVHGYPLSLLLGLLELLDSQHTTRDFL